MGVADGVVEAAANEKEAGLVGVAMGVLLDAAGANENAPGAVAGAFELDALSAPDAVRPINPGVVVVDACFGGVAEGGSGPQLNELADAGPRCWA